MRCARGSRKDCAAAGALEVHVLVLRKPVLFALLLLALVAGPSPVLTASPPVALPFGASASQPAGAEPAGDAASAELAATAAPTLSATPVPTFALITATPAPSPTGALTAPGTPTIAVDPWNGAITLTWTPSLGPIVTSYLIVINESVESQRPIREVAGSQTRATLAGLDPRIGYSFSVIAIDAYGRRGTPSAPATSSGAPTVTPLPTPTIPPGCTRVPVGGPPVCPGLAGSYPRR